MFGTPDALGPTAPNRLAIPIAGLACHFWSLREWLTFPADQ
jgi:hypothetical protein